MKNMIKANAIKKKGKIDTEKVTEGLIAAGIVIGAVLGSCIGLDSVADLENIGAVEKFLGATYLGSVGGVTGGVVGGYAGKAIGKGAEYVCKNVKKLNKFRPTNSKSKEEVAHQSKSAENF